MKLFHFLFVLFCLFFFLEAGFVRDFFRGVLGFFWWFGVFVLLMFGYFFFILEVQNIIIGNCGKN